MSKLSIEAKKFINVGKRISGPALAILLASCGTPQVAPSSPDSSKSGPSTSVSEPRLTAEDVKAISDNAASKAAKEAVDNYKQASALSEATTKGGLPESSSVPKGPEPSPTVNPVDTHNTAVSSDSCVETENINSGNDVVAGLVAETGFPEKVDSGQVEVADGGRFKYQNPLWRNIFAEPGGLWSEPGDEDIKQARRASGGAIQTFNPMQQEVLGTPKYCANLPQGGFAVVTAGRVSVEIERTGLRLDLKETGPRHAHYLAIRGFYPDQKDLTDSNRQMRLSNYKAGFVQYLRMDPLPNNQNVAFLSEGQLYQMLDTLMGIKDSSHTNSGSAGSTEVTITLADVNTKSLRVIHPVTGANKNGALAYTNWNK